MTCLDDELLQEVAEGRRAIAGAVETHLGTCAECRRALSAAARGIGRGRATETVPALADEPPWEELGAGVVVERRYVMDRFLGSGGMGVVWSAERLTDGEHVALKVARSTDASFGKRFEREAKIALALRHPHVVRTYDVVAATPARGPCLVQELLHGETLGARLARERTLPLSDAARMAVPIARALEAAHAAGVVHRDLKPQNVFLDRERVVVLDFGVAKLTEEWGPHTRLTRSGALVGTPAAMAPEQLFGESDVDARADVWALGALVFRMLSGRAPLQGETVGAMIRAAEANELLDLRGLMPDLPTAVLTLVGRALTVDRERRLANVGEFAQVLEPLA